MAPQSTEELIDRLDAGRGRFLDYVRRRVDDPELAEDILQDALVRAVQALPALREEDALLPWFYRVLRNAVTDVYRRHAAEPPRAGLEAAEDLAAEEGAQAELCECFRGLLPALKPEYAELIESLDLGGGSSETEARRLAITPNNLKVRHHRARQALRARLQETCRVCAEHHCLDCTCKQDRH